MMGLAGARVDAIAERTQAAKRISSLCFHRVSDRYTFRAAFGRDMGQARAQAAETDGCGHGIAVRDEMK
jgi:hypothetical protein